MIFSSILYHYICNLKDFGEVTKNTSQTIPIAVLCLTNSINTMTIIDLLEFSMVSAIYGFDMLIFLCKFILVGTYLKKGIDILAKLEVKKQELKKA